MPKRAHPTDAGVDLIANADITIQGMIGTLADLFEQLGVYLPENKRLGFNQLISDLINCQAKVPTGVRNELPSSHVGLIMDKSGLGSRGMKIFGGVIDEGYSGEILISVINFGMTPITLTKGMTKIAQYLTMPITYSTVISTATINGGERGDKGFGSTGD